MDKDKCGQMGHVGGRIGNQLVQAEAGMTHDKENEAFLFFDHGVAFMVQDGLPLLCVLYFIHVRRKKNISTTHKQEGALFILFFDS